ncbi:glycosyltransferase family 2 protein [Loktanella agnita]|uniref:glycosyltransferase family 2 protein n=1 Tax=Loktanella agnita TaxID=287097 RepID=UPI0039890C3A
MPHSKVIITTMKNEAPYILEWVAHHLIIGFDHIVVFTNDCTDGTDELLTRLQELGYLTFRSHKPGRGGVHRSALRRARALNVVKEAEWVYVTDADEFLNIHAGDNTVDALIAASGGDDVDVIQIPWRIFSNNGRYVLRDSLVTEQFTDAEPSYEEGGAGRRFVKSLFRNNETYLRFGSHNPLLRDEDDGKLIWVRPGGIDASNMQMGNHVPPPFGHDVAQVNHYAVRSAQSYLLKRLRGRSSHTGQMIDTSYWDRWNRGGVPDESIHRYAAAMRSQLAVFRADEALDKLHRRGFRWHKSLLKELSKEDDYKRLYHKICNSPPVACHPKDRQTRTSWNLKIQDVGPSTTA